MPRPRRDPGQLSYLGRVLRTLREEADVTLADLAAAIGVHEKTVSRWELSGILPPADQLDVLVRAVDPESPTRAKARILEAAGLLDSQEAEILIQAALKLAAAERDCPASEIMREALRALPGREGRREIAETAAAAQWKAKRARRLLQLNYGRYKEASNDTAN